MRSHLLTGFSISVLFWASGPAAAQFYRRILDKIPAANYDVFNHRAHLSAAEKLRALPKLWLKLRIAGA